jgi:hypothetical protein
MNGKRLRRAVFVCALFSFGFFEVPLALAQQPVFTTVCAVMRDPSPFAGRIVTFRATVQSGFESSTIIDASDPSCSGPWFDLAPKKESPPQRDVYDPELQRRNPVFLVEDAIMKRFDDALQAVVYPRAEKTIIIGGAPRYTVTATMTGRVDYAGEKGSGFGHLNGWRVRFVLSAVRDVDTEELSYDWSKFSRDPVRFPHGTIQGKLTDAQGRPIKLAWVGAIPADGPVPIGYPQVLTEEDGSYSLDVEPGTYLIVVNRDEPANSEVPVLTTYFPDSEIEAGATPLNIVDYEIRTGIDIQIHHILKPHPFDVQVLGNDGRPANAYIYLTQTNRAPIVGPHGVTHTDAQGRGRLVGFEGVDYLLWAKISSWPYEQCAPVVTLDHKHSYAEIIVVKISLMQEACGKQEDEARSAAYASQPR